MNSRPIFLQVFQITFRDIFLLNSKALKRAYAAPTAVLKKPGLIERILLGKSHQEAIHKFPIDENWKIMCWLLFSSKTNRYSKRVLGEMMIHKY